MTRLYTCEGTQQCSVKNGESFRCDMKQGRMFARQFFCHVCMKDFFGFAWRLKEECRNVSWTQALPWHNNISTLARQVLEVLHAGEESTGKRAAHRAKHAYPAALPALRQIPIHATSAEKQIYVMSLPQLIQSKVNSCALFRSSLEWAIKKKGPSLELLLFWDEAVPGNVLSPDLQRKSALT